MPGPARLLARFLVTALAVQAPVFLQPPSAAAQGAITETRYASAGGWTIVRGVIGGRIDYCAATRTTGATSMRISWDGSAWIFATDDARPPAGFTARMEIDDEEFTVSGESDGMWSYVTLAPAVLDAFRSGGAALLETDGDPLELPLDGTAAATDRIRECATT